MLPSCQAHKLLRFAALRPTLSKSAYSSSTLPVNHQVDAASASTSEADVNKIPTNRERWDLFSAICIERLPRIAPPMNIIEIAVKQAMENYEHARSLMSDHETRKMRERESAKKQASEQKDADDENPQETNVQLAEDFEEKCLLELKSFETFVSQHQNPNYDADQKDLRRYLHRHLMLLLKQQLGQTTSWRVPEMKLLPDETLRDAANRCLQLYVEPGQVRIMGNSPFCVLKYHYPKPVSSKLNALGKKLFYFKAQLISNNLELKRSSTDLFQDYGWFNRDECRQIMPKSNWKAISSGLLMEEPHPDTVNGIFVYLEKAKNRTIGQQHRQKDAQAN